MIIDHFPLAENAVINTVNRIEKLSGIAFGSKNQIDAHGNLAERSEELGA
jgi:hypothetical protein